MSSQTFGKCKLCNRTKPLDVEGTCGCKGETREKSEIIEELKQIADPKNCQIAKKSKTQKQKDAQYLKQRKPFLKRNPKCKAKLDGCWEWATEVHHTKGRIGDNYLDETTWLPVCLPCHRHLEVHPTEAKEKGLSQSRLAG